MKNHKSIGKLASMLKSYSLSYFDYKLKPYGINAGQFPILIVLYQNEQVSQKTISKLLNLDKTSLARTIKKLEEEKYIKRKQDKNDKRAYSIYLTVKAKKIERDIKKIARLWTEIILEDFSKKGKDQFFFFFEQACVNARNYIKGTKNEK